MVVYENSTKTTSPPFYLSLRSSLFYLFLPTCNGFPLVVASSRQLHFQSLEVPTYVLNVCVHVGFQVPTILALMFTGRSSTNS
jgi:hypothetical protein